MSPLSLPAFRVDQTYENLAVRGEVSVEQCLDVTEVALGRMGIQVPTLAPALRSCYPTEPVKFPPLAAAQRYPLRKALSHPKPSYWADPKCPMEQAAPPPSDRRFFFTPHAAAERPQQSGRTVARGLAGRALPHRRPNMQTTLEWAPIPFESCYTTFMSSRASLRR